MKIPNKKIFAYIKKYDKLDFCDIKHNSAFNKFKVDDIANEILQKVQWVGSLKIFDGHNVYYFSKIEENNDNIYYGAVNGYFKRNPKLFYTYFRDKINENGYTYLLSLNRFVVEFKKDLRTWYLKQLNKITQYNEDTK